MRTVSEALADILALIAPTKTERVPLAVAAGRVLAEDVAAGVSHPGAAVSAMDGYAIRSADAGKAPALRVIGALAAGHYAPMRVGPGEAARIFTGSVIPEGADAVVIQEVVERDGDIIRLNTGVSPGEYVRPEGMDFRAGDALLPAPRRLTPEDVALAAAMNAPTLTVSRPPRIAILPTGDELVLPGSTQGIGQVIASSGYGLAALLARHGADPTLLLPSPDDLDRILEGLASQPADLLVTLGGASVGDRDLIGRGLGGASVGDRDLIGRGLGGAGLDVAFHGVAVRPGKPLLAGRFGGTPLVALPGNPVSAMVCGHLFLRPAIDRALGLPAGPLPRRTALLTRALPAASAREHYMRASVEARDGGAACTPAESQDSSVLRELARANALAIRPPHAPPARPGDPIEYVEL